MRKLFVPILLVAGLALVAGACSSSDESSDTTVQKDSGEKTTTTTEGSGSKSFDVQTPEGQASISLDGELPPNWPEDFPAPKSSKVAGSGSLASSSKGVSIGVYSTSTSGQDVFDTYKGDGELNASDAKSVSPGSTFLGTMQISGTYDGSITITTLSDTTYVVVLLKTDGGGTDLSTTTTVASSGGSTSSSTSTTMG